MAGTTNYKFSIDITGTNSAGITGQHGVMTINNTTHIVTSVRCPNGSGTLLEHIEAPGTLLGGITPDNYCNTTPVSTPPTTYQPLTNVEQSHSSSTTDLIDFGQGNVGGLIVNPSFITYDNSASGTGGTVLHWLLSTEQISSGPNTYQFKMLYLLASDTTTWHPVTTTTGNNYIISFSEAKNPACFIEGTKLFAHVHDKDLYVNIEDLRSGDIVNTYLHGKKKIKYIGKGNMTNNPAQWNGCVRRLPKSGDMTDDLLVTGAHSILVDELSEKESEGMTAVYGTADRKVDDKTLLLSWVSSKFEAVDDNKEYTYYHLVLEHDDDVNKRYGIFANGVLTESQSEKHFLDKNYVIL
jgi:hypothetical protein